MSTTRVLAEYVCAMRAGDVAPAPREMAIHCIFDALTAALVGLRVPSVVNMRAAASQLYGVGTSPAWFCGEGLTAAGAVLCNSAAVAVLDLDDGHAEARGHPGAAVIPAALAAAIEVNASLDELLTAIIAGYEVGVRIKAARGDHGQKDEHGQSGVWVGFAAAAAVGKLLKLSPNELSHALAMVGVYSPNLIATGYTNDTGADIKEGIPWSAGAGYAAARMAEAGLTGFEDILDHGPFYDAGRIVAGLGESQLKICDTYFKPYATCRHFHGALRALENLMTKNSVEPSTIRSIDVHIFDYALRLSNKVKPETLTDIQYSIPYCMAVGALLGGNALLPVSEKLFGRPEIVKLAGKVRLHAEPDLSARYPAEALAWVVVRAGGETYKSTITPPSGGPELPMSMDDLMGKFRFVTRDTCSKEQQERVVVAADRLRAGDLSSLMALIKSSFL